MNAKLILLVGAAALPCYVGVARIDSPKDNNNPSAQNIAPQRERETTPMASLQLGELARTKYIIGSDIRDNEGHVIGKVKDLALDLQNDRIVEVIIGTGGMMGVNERIVAVPSSILVTDRTMNSLRLNADKDLIARSPEFDLATWDASTDGDQVRRVYQRFGVEPYFFHDEQSQTVPNKPATENRQVAHYYHFDSQNALPRMGVVVRATRLEGTAVVNPQNKRLGKVDDFIVDMSAGRLVEVVVAHGGFLGMNTTLTAVPPESFQWNAASNELSLNISQNTFDSAPHFKASEWGFAYEPATVAEVYANYQVRPWFLTFDMDSTAQQVRERVDQSSPESLPSQAGNGPTVAPAPQSLYSTPDRETTTRVEKSLMNADGLTTDSRKDITVKTSEGKVILTGSVATEQDRMLAEQAAEKIVPLDKIDNQLQIRNSSPAFK